MLLQEVFLLNHATSLKLRQEREFYLESVRFAGSGPKIWELYQII